MIQPCLKPFNFADMEVAPNASPRSLQRLAAAKRVTLDSGKNAVGTAPAYPGGFAVLSSTKGDRASVALAISIRRSNRRRWKMVRMSAV
jgi:hypothetical protein